MADIPLFRRSQHKAKKLTDYSALNEGLGNKGKSKCYRANRFTDLQKEFQGAVRLIHPATLYPVCPAMCRLINEEIAREREIDTQIIDEFKSKCNDSTVQYFPLWASIFRILRVLDSLRMGSKPSLETVVRYIHTEYKLKRQFDLIRNDLLVLPQRLEKNYLKTSNECKELIARYEIEIAHISYGNQLSAFLVPNGIPDELKDANSTWTWTSFLDWRKEQINYTRHDYQATMLSLTRYYPIEAIKAMLPLYNILSPILLDLSEQIKAGLQCNANLKKMFEESIAKLTKLADDKAEDTKLAPAEEKAYQSYEYAIKKWPDLAGKTDKNVHDWLSENGIPDYDMPSFETWTRQLRTGRKHYGTNKNTPRAERESNVPKVKNDPDLLKQMSNQYTKPD